MTLIRNANAAPSNTLTRFVPLPFLRAIYGFILSIGSPLGWILIQFIAGRDPFSETNLDWLLYGYISIATAITFSLLGYGIGKREVMITELALTDGLTKLNNKRYYLSRLEQEFQRHRRNNSPMSVIQIDVDFFKNINDNYGHQAGDDVLRQIAHIIQENCRKNEVAARVGGEELSIIAIDCEESDALILAERIRERIKETDFSPFGIPFPITASFGIASTKSQALSAQDVYKHADEALYIAKQTGRDKSVCFSKIAH